MGSYQCVGLGVEMNFFHPCAKVSSAHAFSCSHTHTHHITFFSSSTPFSQIFPPSPIFLSPSSRPLSSLLLVPPRFRFFFSSVPLSSLSLPPFPSPSVRSIPPLPCPPPSLILLHTQSSQPHRNQKLSTKPPQLHLLLVPRSHLENAD